MAPPKTWTVSNALLGRRMKVVSIPTLEAYGTWSLDQLKLECTSRKLNAAKNTNKEGRIALLTAYDTHKSNTQRTVQQQRSNARRGHEEMEKRTKNCMFRLLNVLFSESFFNGLLTSGNQLSRSELDQGGSGFWGDVATAFCEADVLYDTKVSSDAIFDDIDPSQTVAHSGAKLHRM